MTTMAMVDESMLPTLCLEYLDARDLVAASSVSRAWRAASETAWAALGAERCRRDDYWQWLWEQEQEKEEETTLERSNDQQRKEPIISQARYWKIERRYQDRRRRVERALRAHSAYWGSGHTLTGRHEALWPRLQNEPRQFDFFCRLSFRSKVNLRPICCQGFVPLVAEPNRRSHDHDWMPSLSQFCQWQFDLSSLNEFPAIGNPTTCGHNGDDATEEEEKTIQKNDGTHNNSQQQWNQLFSLFCSREDKRVNEKLYHDDHFPFLLGGPPTFHGYCFEAEWLTVTIVAVDRYYKDPPVYPNYIDYDDFLNGGIEDRRIRHQQQRQDQGCYTLLSGNFPMEWSDQRTGQAQRHYPDYYWNQRAHLRFQCQSSRFTHAVPSENRGHHHHHHGNNNNDQPEEPRTMNQNMGEQQQPQQHNKRRRVLPQQNNTHIPVSCRLKTLQLFCGPAITLG